MTATRTIAIGLPDDPNASIWDVLASLNLTVGNLNASGDFHSGALVANLLRHLNVPHTPADPIWADHERFRYLRR
jgi:hypothetical protein